MCVTFTPSKPSAIQRLTGQKLAVDYPVKAFPGYAAPIVKGSGAAGLESKPLVASLARFGLIPSWAKDAAFGRRTYNARTETVAEKPSYRTAWRQRQFCLVPMEEFFEPCWETGKAVQWSIHRKDGEPFTVAAIWDIWTDKASGEIVNSFSMLTINANDHPVMGRFHRPEDEKRSLVVVPLDGWHSWISATPATAFGLLQAMPVDEFAAAAVQPSQPSLLEHCVPNQ